MKLAALISGGKDSILALYQMHKAGHEIKYLLVMEPETDESYMFHHPNTWITKLISESLNIPLIKGTTQGRKEEELTDLKELLQKVACDVDGVITGALASTYQKERIDRLCSDLSLESLAPLWGITAEKLWQELFENNFKVMITAVAAEGLSDKWLGQIVDENNYSELARLSRKHRFHLGFEGGEAETLVLDMPLYNEKIAVKKGSTQWDGRSGSYLIGEAVLERKP
ncbi:ATP-binding region [archaeon BMS3Bbin16]|nr:ATP-binding region [archaeon BMS3Bbin16]